MERILAALKSWDADESAFCRAWQIAIDRSASLTLVHVPGANVSGDTLRLLRDELRREADAKLSEPDKLHLEVEVLQGYPADAILATAEDPLPDLIVLGDHHGLRLRDRVFGTTGTQVVRDAQCPVLIVRRKSSRSYERVMAAVDDITSAERILAAACSIGRIHRLTVVHVLDDVEEDGRNLLAEPATMYQRSLEDCVAHLRKRHPGMEVDVEIARGQNGALQNLAERWVNLGPDLLVIGSRGRNPLMRLFSSSYAEMALLGCSSDVLIVPTSADAGGWD